MQIVPAAEHFGALPFQLFELELLGFGRGRVGAANGHCEIGQLGIDLRRVGQGIFVGANRQVDQLIAHRHQLFLEIIRRSGNGLGARVFRQPPFQACDLRTHILNLVHRVVDVVQFLLNLHQHTELLRQILRAHIHPGV